MRDEDGTHRETNARGPLTIEKRWMIHNDSKPFVKNGASRTVQNRNPSLLNRGTSFLYILYATLVRNKSGDD